MKTTIKKQISQNRIIRVDIQLDDECHNGHQDFSITGEIWENGSMVSCGCIHEEILQYCPELKPFVDLHLSTFEGVPMHAVENGFYHLQKNPQIAKEYLRLNDEEYAQIKNTKERDHFVYVLETCGVFARWRKQADKAIKKLEEMTGETWRNTSTRFYTFTPDDERKKIERKIKRGYYLPASIEARHQKKLQKEQREKLQDLRLRYQRTAKENKKEYDIKKWLISRGIETENVIYYPSRDAVVIGWRFTLTEQEKEEYVKKLQDFPFIWKFEAKK